MRFRDQIVRNDEIKNVHGVYKKETNLFIETNTFKKLFNKYQRLIAYMVQRKLLKDRDLEKKLCIADKIKLCYAQTYLCNEDGYDLKMKNLYYCFYKIPHSIL